MVALGLFGATAIPMAARAVDFPRARVICDGDQQGCWDAAWRRRNVNPLLSRQNETVWQYYVVQMDNGRLYRFQRRASQLVLRDATGTWPVFISDRGNGVQFRWANLQLDVSPLRQARGGAPDGVVPPTPTPRSTGETGQDLLDNIFP